MKRLTPNLVGAGMHIAVVFSRFNAEVSERLLAACLEALAKHGVSGEHLTVTSVPGALEVPLAAQRLAQSGKFAALIALGAVVRGETYHFEIVANESAAGLMSVQLETGVPIANGLLTTDTEEQAIARAPVKGAECAAVAVEMANLLRALDQ